MFDLQGARKAGYRDDEIADYLASQSGFDAAGARQAGYSDSEILDHLAGGKINAAMPSQVQPESMTWGEVGRQAVSNIDDSAVRMARDIWTAVSSPIDTAKAIGSLTVGDVKQMVADRYGSVDALKQTLATDPVGVAGDLSTLFAGGGLALKGAGAAGKSARLAGAGRAATRVADTIDPVGLALRGAGKTAQTVAKAPLVNRLTPERLYQSAAKFTTAKGAGYRDNLVRTALEEGIPVSDAGLDKIATRRAGLGNQIDSIIERGAQAGDAVGADEVIRRLEGVDVMAGNPALGTAGARAIDRTLGRVAAAYPDGKIPVADAQRMKREIYAANPKAYGDLRPMQTEVQKQFARGLKEEIERLYPEIKGLNERSGSLKALNDELERAVARIDNHNLLSLGTLLSTGAGAAAGGPAGAVGGLVLKSVIENPRVKSRLAIALAKARKNTPALNRVAPVEARTAAMQAGRVNQDEFRGR